jgi:hypothetical protein
MFVLCQITSTGVANGMFVLDKRLGKINFASKMISSVSWLIFVP